MKTRRSERAGAAGDRTAGPGDHQITLGLASAIFLGLALIFFLPAFFPDRHIFGTDYLAAGYFFQEFISGRLAAAELPKWVPYLYGGLPLFSNPASTYYPFRLVADFLLPVQRIMPALYVVQFACAGIGMYLLARELGARRWVGLFAGLAFQFTGLIVSFVYAGHDGRIIVATLAPLFFFFLHRGIRTGALGAFAGAAATIGFALLSFQIQSAYYLLLAGALWGAFALVHLGVLDTPRQLARRAALGVGAVALGFALASVNFLPFLDYVSESPRGGEGGRGYEYSTSWSMPPSETLGIAVPEAAGILDDYRGANPFKLHTEYVGVPVVALFLLGFVCARRNRYWWFFLGLAVLGLTISFGGHTPLYRVYYELLPGTKKFRAPSIAFFIVAFALVAMAAITLERLAALREREGVGADEAGDRTRGSGELSTARWVLVALVALAIVAAVVTRATAATDPAEASTATGYARFAIFALLVGGAIVLWLRRSIPTRPAAAVLIVLTFIDLWIIDRKFFETVPGPDVMFAPDDVVRFLGTVPKPFRVWVLPFPAGQVYRGGGDYLMLYDIDQAGGEHGNQLQRYNELVGAGERTYVDWHNFLRHSAFLNAANVRYVISRVPLDVPIFREVHRGSAVVYENLGALPRAYLVPRVTVADADGDALRIMARPDFDPSARAVVYERPDRELPTGLELRGSAEITEYEPDRVVVKTTANRPAFLVLADNHYKGWKATADGAEVPLYLANHAFRGVFVDAGEHEITFLFRPRDLYIGFAIYLVTLTLLAGYAGILLWRRWRSEQRAAAAG